MRILTQSAVVLGLGLASLPQRKWSSLVIVASMACVIGVLLSMLSVTGGMLRAYRAGGDARLAIVLSAQNDTEYGEGIPVNAVGIILNAPGIARGTEGHPLADAEVLFWVPPMTAEFAGAPELRGIGAAGLALRPNLRIVAGRMFRSGRQELIVGVTAAHAYHLHLGDQITLPGGEWPIVGVFTEDGSILEGQLVGDVITLTSAAHMSGFGSVLVRLARPDAFQAFAHWLTTNPALQVTAERHSDYAARTVNLYTAFFAVLTYAIGAIMAIGALFATLKLTYTAVSVRTHEIATLRAIGYLPLPLALSVLLEAALLALLAAILGGAAAWLLFDGRIVADIHNVFDLTVSPRLFAVGIAWALAVAILGGLPPAIRAARLTVTAAHRAL
ncbi:MAG TPA: FtsX-like permease family protein [Steroidobacteraceae bacterium]|nr:FtsX-like permease family protein [Steroidobacteraceae bacterium]